MSRRDVAPDTGSEAGMVSAETAAAIPAVLIVLAISVAGLMSGIDQIRCTDAVRVGARMAARGDSDDQVRSAVTQRVRAGSSITVHRTTESVSVTVSGSSRMAGIAPVSACTATAGAPREGPPP